MNTANIELEERELAKIDKISSDEGLVEKERFEEFARKSHSVKELFKKERRSSSINVDKAVLAFKVND